MFQHSEISNSQQRSRFQSNILPKIGSANPEMNRRVKRASEMPDGRKTLVIKDQSGSTERHGSRKLNTAQPFNMSFPKSQVHSQ